MNDSNSHVNNIQIQPKHSLLTPSSSTSSSPSVSAIASTSGSASAATSTSVAVHHHRLNKIQQSRPPSYSHHHHNQIQNQHQHQHQHQHHNHHNQNYQQHSVRSSIMEDEAVYGGTPNSIKRQTDIPDCSSSTSSCCSSAASVAADIDNENSVDAPVAVTPAVVNGHGSVMMTQKVSRTIPSDKINLRLILVSGKTKEFLFNPSDSAGDIAQTVFDNWPEDWEREAVSKAEILRLIYQGRFLHCNVTLGALGLPLGKTTVMHLVPRDNLPEPNSQDQRQKSKGGSSRCCSTTCCIL